MNIPRQLMLALGLICTLSVVGADSFYKEPYGIFSTRPDAKKSLQTIKRFGPVGLGIDLIQPAFTMRIANVEEGSPAAATGKLAKGQIIDSINGRKLADIDPRIQFGQLLAQAEATDGLLKFTIRGVAAPVTVQVPVLGAYSKTWPLNCPKSDKIVRQVADYLSQPDAQKGLAGIGVLFLLSTGEAKDLAVAREWARSVKPHRYPWYIGYGGIPLAEAYLRTGDPVILANIQAGVDNAVATQYLGGWLGRGGVTPSYGNGHLNAAGTHVLTFLLLAKECGAKVPDQTLDDALVHFYRYAGRGGIPMAITVPSTGLSTTARTVCSLLPWPPRQHSRRTANNRSMLGPAMFVPCRVFTLLASCSTAIRAGGSAKFGVALPWGCCTRRNPASTVILWISANGIMIFPAASTAPSAFLVGPVTTRNNGVWLILWPTRFRVRHSVLPARRPLNFQNFSNSPNCLGAPRRTMRFFLSRPLLMPMDTSRISVGKRSRQIRAKPF